MYISYYYMFIHTYWVGLFADKRHIDINIGEEDVSHKSATRNGNKPWQVLMGLLWNRGGYNLQNRFFLTIDGMVVETCGNENVGLPRWNLSIITYYTHHYITINTHEFDLLHYEHHIKFPAKSHSVQKKHHEIHASTMKFHHSAHPWTTTGHPTPAVGGWPCIDSWRRKRWMRYENTMVFAPGKRWKLVLFPGKWMGEWYEMMKRSSVYGRGSTLFWGKAVLTIAFVAILILWNQW